MCDGCTYVSACSPLSTESCVAVYLTHAGDSIKPGQNLLLCTACGHVVLGKQAICLRWLVPRQALVVKWNQNKRWGVGGYLFEHMKAG